MFDTLNLDYAATRFAYVAVALMVLMMFRWVANAISPHDDDKEICQHNNNALSLQRASLYGALFLGMAGSFFRNPADSFGQDLLVFMQDSAFVALALLVGMYVIDAFILRHVPNKQQLMQNNLAVGVAEAGAYLGFGAVLAGSFAGDGGGIASALVFSAIGLALMGVTYWVYEHLTPHTVERELLDGNVACAIETGSLLLSIGVVMGFSIAGPFQGWAEDLLSFGVYWALGTTLFFLFRWLFDVVALPHVDAGTALSRTNRSTEGATHHWQTAVSIQLAGATTAMALLVGVVI